MEHPPLNKNDSADREIGTALDHIFDDAIFLGDPDSGVGGGDIFLPDRSKMDKKPTKASK